MLVLSRKQNERLIIDGNIVVSIVRVSGGTVRIGIEAPRDVSIRREELCSRPSDYEQDSLLTGRVALAGCSS
jgi:carbon storage regulator